MHLVKCILYTGTIYFKYIVTKSI